MSENDTKRILGDIATSEEVSIPRDFFRAMIHALDWYASLKDPELAIRAQITLGLVRGELVIVRCGSCNGEIVRIPVPGGVDDPNQICPECSGPVFKGVGL